MTCPKSHSKEVVGLGPWEGLPQFVMGSQGKETALRTFLLKV